VDNGGAASCSSGVCSAGACQAPTCFDTVKNGTETGVDCSGTCAAKCSNGLGCITGSDCQSGICTLGVCKAPTCSDGVKNGAEIGVDCGGTLCGPCWISDAPPAYSHTQGCFWSFGAGVLDGHKSLDMSGATAANMIADFGVPTFVDVFAANAWSSAYALGGMKGFSIDSSPDKITWTTQFNGTHPSSSATQYYGFAGTTARYWRLRITSFYMNFGTSCGTGQFQGGFQFRSQ
jgi:hypothetical protein